MKNDYRNTKYCVSLEKVDEKKKKLDKQIRKDHPKAKIIYNKVKAKDYKKFFMEIYNDKCGYCGNSLKNISVNLFEVDHYICASYFDSKEEAGKNSKEEAGKIENLVLACYDCNRSKRDLLIEELYREMLNPDGKKIRSVFQRDDLFYIKITKAFENDPVIKEFYIQLKLGYQTRRLDFLLMSLRGLCDKLAGTSKKDKLNEILVKLQEKRNIATFK